MAVADSARIPEPSRQPPPHTHGTSSPPTEAPMQNVTTHLPRTARDHHGRPTEPDHMRTPHHLPDHPHPAAAPQAIPATSPAKCSPAESWTRKIATATASDDKVRHRGRRPDHVRWGPDAVERVANLSRKASTCVNRPVRLTSSRPASRRPCRGTRPPVACHSRAGGSRTACRGQNLRSRGVA